MKSNNEPAVGQSTSEYVTEIFRICGIDENWGIGDRGRRVWVSDSAKMRAELEKLIDLLKRRVVENVKEHLEC